MWRHVSATGNTNDAPVQGHASGLHCDSVIKTKADKMNYLNKQRGLSLIELMIAMGLGVLLLLGLVTVFMTANQSSKTTIYIRESR